MHMYDTVPHFVGLVHNRPLFTLARLATLLHWAGGLDRVKLGTRWLGSLQKSLGPKPIPLLLCGCPFAYIAKQSLSFDIELIIQPRHRTPPLRFLIRLSFISCNTRILSQLACCVKSYGMVRS